MKITTNPMTQMLTSREIKILHLESTDVCQAACSLCARESDRNFDKSKKNYLTVEHLGTLLSNQFVANLEKMFMCGNYGDPAANSQSLSIYRWFRRLNPDIVLGMNTNGGLQTTFWWHELGKILNQSQDYVVFSIDGLEDTNSYYRVNVNWKKVMANVEAFIAAGGSAHWDMLVYRHNQHQVDACQNLAKRMGFRWFRAKVSKRGFSDRLQFPIGWKNPVVDQGPIECQALQKQSIYIDAQGRCSPCCWLGATQTDFVTDDLATVSQSWNTSHPNATCKRICSTVANQNSFTNQWQREVELV